MVSKQSTENIWSLLPWVNPALKLPQKPSLGKFPHTGDHSIYLCVRIVEPKPIKPTATATATAPATVTATASATATDPHPDAKTDPAKLP